MALTLLRLALVPVFLALLIAAPRGGALRAAAVGVFGLSAITDVLDGYLARRLNQVTPIGTLLDPLADKLLLSASLLILALPRYSRYGSITIPWAVTLGAYLKDFGVILGIIIVRRELHRVRIGARLAGKLSTFSQVSLVLATLLGADLVRALGPSATAWLLWILWWAVTWTAAASGMDYARVGATQWREARAGLGEGCNVQHPTANVQR
jgi:CDP-diacylglycerol--glycerol-3-phosphate 3-phosphatidyltransferase